MLRTNRQMFAAVLLAAGLAGVGAMAGAQSPAADDQEKQAREALQEAEAQLRAAEAQSRAAEAKLKLAQANHERAKNARLAKQEAPLRQRLQSLEWTLEEVQAAGAGAFTLRLNHSQRLFLSDLRVARDARVVIDEGPGKLADLKIGMRLGLTLAAHDLVVTEIDAHSPEEPNDYRVKEVDAEKETLSVTRAGKDFLTGLFVGDLEILLENDDVTLYALKPGMQVSLTFVASGGQLVVQKVHARK